MLRHIIRIDEKRCTGCGLCVEACREGALGLIDGKARLLRDDWCDGMGLCLPACPADALSFEEREAAPFDAEAVQERMARIAPPPVPAADEPEPEGWIPPPWPVQIRLAPVTAPQFDNADLLVAADCCAFVCPDFCRRFTPGRVVLVGCPKLDDTDYAEKLGRLFTHRSIRSVLVTRMEVPCCEGLEGAVRRALAASGKPLEPEIRVISRRGGIVGKGSEGLRLPKQITIER